MHTDAFKQEVTLTRHERHVHDGVRAYACTDCNAKFATKQHLDQHRLTHSGERPHACPVCPVKDGRYH